MFEARIPSRALLIDGVAHHVSDIAVLRSDPLPGGLPFSLSLKGTPATRFLKAVPGLRSGRPRTVIVQRVLVALQRMLRHTSPPFARFSVATITDVEVGPARVRLLGTCSLILLSAPPPLWRRSDEES